MTPGDTTNQTGGNFGIGVVKGASGPITVSAVQSYTQQFEALVRQIEEAEGSDEAKAEAKSRLKRFLEHPIVSAILSGLASSLKL
jgi:hypothetical protein